jgi:hypothetical protein
VLAGERKNAKRLASDGLALARQVGAPGSVTMNRNALAGALINESPERAKELLREGRQLRGGFEQTAAGLTQSVLLWAQLRE